MQKGPQVTEQTFPRSLLQFPMILGSGCISALLSAESPRLGGVRRAYPWKSHSLDQVMARFWMERGGSCCMPGPTHSFSMHLFLSVFNILLT